MSDREPVQSLRLCTVQEDLERKESVKESEGENVSLDKYSIMKFSSHAHTCAEHCKSPGQLHK